MKKTLCALMVMGAFATTAQAQTSVTLYGIIDASIGTQSNSGLPGGGHTTAFTDAPILPSVYGFKGTEDLGGGMSASFNLEGGFNSGKGTHNSPGVYQSQFFGREAKVALSSSDWGTVAAGLQVDPGVIASISTEPRGLTDSFSMVEYWIDATLFNGGGPAGSSGSLAGGLFDVNSLTYTYAKNGLYVGLEYGFGGVAGASSAGTTESIGVSYAHAGFLVSGSYAKATSPNPALGNTSAIDVVGLGYDFGEVALRGQYGEFKFAFGGAPSYTDDVKVWGVGVDWKTSVANKVNLAYYDAKDDGTGIGGSTTELALLDIYALSKHTQVYAQVASVKADANAGMSAGIGGVYTPSGSLTAAAGATTTFFGIGLQHSF